MAKGKKDTKKTAEKRKASENEGDVTHAKKAMATFFSYHIDGKGGGGNGDPEQKPELKQELIALREEYKSLSGNTAMANAFAQKFMDTKKEKNFGWAKNFKEEYTAVHTERAQMKENYMTRTKSTDCRAFIDIAGHHILGVRTELRPIRPQTHQCIPQAEVTQKDPTSEGGLGGGGGGVGVGGVGGCRLIYTPK